MPFFAPNRLTVFLVLLSFRDGKVLAVGMQDGNSILIQTEVGKGDVM